MNPFFTTHTAHVYVDDINQKLDFKNRHNIAGKVALWQHVTQMSVCVPKQYWLISVYVNILNYKLPAWVFKK